MPGLVLDTTVLIDVLRGRPAVARLRLLQRERLPLLTTAIDVEEVARGLRESEAGAARSLFAGLHVLSVRQAEGELAGRWRRDHAARGVTLRQADCLVAACAATIGAGLATGNPGDFPMPDLRVEVWPVGS
ncbi:type II toxin-antitoxin system VapC family toxin [Aquipuribacter sp. MA13-6]|uniref:type II toxin-antitoxin system VapC family toxin n=1 Tax=unclassified Aquipuribacter TaxID=2635084 RepID=UPI003EEF7F76